MRRWSRKICPILKGKNHNSNNAKESGERAKYTNNPKNKFRQLKTYHYNTLSVYHLIITTSFNVFVKINGTATKAPQIDVQTPVPQVLKPYCCISFVRFSAARMKYNTVTPIRIML